MKQSLLIATCLFEMRVGEGPQALTVPDVWDLVERSVPIVLRKVSEDEFKVIAEMVQVLN